MLTAFATLYALGKSDDEDYKDMDLRTRDGNWILGDGLKIGVPTELGAIFKVIPERMVEYYKRKGTPEEQEAMEAVRTAVAYIAEQYFGRAMPIRQNPARSITVWKRGLIWMISRAADFDSARVITTEGTLAAKNT